MARRGRLAAGTGGEEIVRTESAKGRTQRARRTQRWKQCGEQFPHPGSVLPRTPIWKCTEQTVAAPRRAASECARAFFGVRFCRVSDFGLLASLSGSTAARRPANADSSTSKSMASVARTNPWTASASPPHRAWGTASRRSVASRVSSSWKSSMTIRTASGSFPKVQRPALFLQRGPDSYHQFGIELCRLFAQVRQELFGGQHQHGTLFGNEVDPPAGEDQ